MIRLAFQVLLVALTAANVTFAFADPLFSTNPNNSNTSGGRFKSRLSPDDYVNAVNQVDMQTKSSLNQQAKSLFPKPGATTPGMATQPTPSLPTNQPPEYSISNPPPTTQPTGVAQQPTSTLPQQAGSYSPRPPAQSAPAPTQTQTYTGFGGSSTGTSSPAKSSGSTGLGIKY